MLQKILVSIVALFLSCSSVSAKLIHKDYSNHKYWKVYSLTPKNAKTAMVCVITSKNQAFFLSYTGFEGWKLTVYYKKILKLKSKTANIKFYVDNEYIGSKLARIDSKSKSVEIILGLDTSILNPIIKGQRLVTKLYKLRFVTSLYGLKRAYIKSLGCWRERMDSVPYVADKKSNNKPNKKLASKKPKITTNLSDVKGIALTKIFATELGFSENKVTNSNSGAYIDIELSNGNKFRIGSVVQFDFKGKTLSSSDMTKWVDDMSAVKLDDCNRIGIEKHRPYFTKHNAQVFSRTLICWVDDKPNRHHHIWLVQSKTKLTQFVAIIPIELGQASEEQQKRAMESVSYFLD